VLISQSSRFAELQSRIDGQVLRPATTPGTAHARPST
jgi:hypothetical protein